MNLSPLSLSDSLLILCFVVGTTIFFTRNRWKDWERNTVHITVHGFPVCIRKTGHGHGNVKINTPKGAPNKKICDYLKKEGFLVNTPTGLKFP